MYDIEDLFDKRSVIGTKIEQLLVERKCTKAELSMRTGVSRPTIDKLIAGTLTSKTNYEKHISKILNYLEMTPDMLLGKSINQYSRTRAIRNLRNLSTEEVSKATGISFERLQQIEAGEKATVAELRDIAKCLSISVSVLKRENYFEPQIAEMADFIEFNRDKNSEGLSGFWGHVGILLRNMDKYLWFPITSKTRRFVYSGMNNERLVIPCMNNKVLYLYMPNVKEIVLLDDACDQPSYINWDYDVSSGEIPLSVYEALEDYIMPGVFEDESEKLSSAFKEYLDYFTREKEWSEEDIYDVLNLTSIYYEDGKIRNVDIDFEYGYENVSEEIMNAYEFGDSDFFDDILFFTDLEGAEILINVKNISMMELPFLKVEKAIMDKR